MALCDSVLRLRKLRLKLVSFILHLLKLQFKRFFGRLQLTDGCFENQLPVRFFNFRVIQLLPKPFKLRVLLGNSPGQRFIVVLEVKNLLVKTLTPC